MSKCVSSELQQIQQLNMLEYKLQKLGWFKSQHEIQINPNYFNT